jgi:hypothetical protein
MGAFAALLQSRCGFDIRGAAAPHVHDHRRTVQAIANDHSRRRGAVGRLLPLGRDKFGAWTLNDRWEVGPFSQAIATSLVP